jgi:hypothetical protein
MTDSKPGSIKNRWHSCKEGHILNLHGMLGRGKDRQHATGMEHYLRASYPTPSDNPWLPVQPQATEAGEVAVEVPRPMSTIGIFFGADSGITRLVGGCDARRAASGSCARATG